MELFGWLVFIVLIIIGIIYIKNEFIVFIYELKNKDKDNKNNKNYFERIYSKKDLMTKYERYFYDIFVELEEELDIKKN